MFPRTCGYNLVLPYTYMFIRNVHQNNFKKPVRVRFAPSPTGFLHLGGLRTALYNYLFAKGPLANGRFILRIEDTDQSRQIPGAQERLIEDLKWSGIEIDEGPLIGGNYGPYAQSERIDYYRSAVNKLLENGTAYYCTCSERRLDILRKDALRTRQVPKYDNKCRYLTPSQVAEKLASNQRFCIRFKLTTYTEPLKDIIYGDVVNDISENEGDPVLIKSDGFPTYHFANVVDDHLMKISHVLRGVEWQISTTKHLLLYKAFGWEPPQYGHLPLLVNADGTKLSKRQGDIDIKHYRDLGIFPQALVNYVMSAGGGFNHDQHKKPKSYSIPELSNQFDITKVNSHPSRLNSNLLPEFNRLEIQRLTANNTSADQLVYEVQNMLKIAYPDKESSLDLNSIHVRNVLNWASNRIFTLKDLTEGKLAFLWVRPESKVSSDLSTEMLEDFLKKLNEADFQKDHLQNVLKDFAKTNQLKFPYFMKCCRSALSGGKEGPSVAEMMEILGKPVSLERLRNNIQTKCN